MRTEEKVALAVGGSWFVVFLLSIVAWFTHIFVCLKAASWGFLIAGAIFFPVAIVHGVGVWFGAF